MRFIANYKYNIKPSTLEKVGNLQSDKADLTKIPTTFAPGEGFDSDCSSTMVGFLTTERSSMTNHKVSCYYGVMVQKNSKLELKDNLK